MNATNVSSVQTSLCMIYSSALLYWSLKHSALALAWKHMVLLFLKQALTDFACHVHMNIFYSQLTGQHPIWLKRTEQSWDRGEQDLALELYVSGNWPVNDNDGNSLKSQWNQRPSFALKMVNVFTRYWSPNKPTVPGVVSCIYFKGELSETTTICLSCVFTKRGC